MMDIRLPRTKVLWMLPDDTIVESHVADPVELLQLIKLVDTVSIHAMKYRVIETELLVMEGATSILSVSLQ